MCFCIAVCFEISKTEKREREETGEDQTQQRDAAKLFVAQCTQERNHTKKNKEKSRNGKFCRSSSR